MSLSYLNLIQCQAYSKQLGIHNAESGIQYVRRTPLSEMSAQGSIARTLTFSSNSENVARQRLPTRLTGPPRFMGRPGVTARATGRATSRTPGLTMQPAG